MAGITETHIATFLTKPLRLQEYGVDIFHAVPTKSALKKAIKKRQITVDGNIGSTATYIFGGEKIVLSIPEQTVEDTKLKLALDILYEDDHLAAVDKPAGIKVSGNRFMTIANALSQNLKASSLEDVCIPQPVHRLDYPTTGILLSGKTSSSIRALNQLFKDKKVQKTYYAVTIGKMPVSGTIDRPVDDKESTSTYDVIASINSERFERLNLVKLQPFTGRRHQLRKHMFSLGNPILGDRDYHLEGKLLKGKGLYLHAYSVSFKHPFTEDHIVIAAPFPKKFKKLFDVDTLLG